MTTAIHSGFPAWSQRLISELAAVDERALHLAKGLTLEQMNWRPRPDAWTVGQCLKHLHITNEVYLPAISKSLEGRRSSRVPEVSLGWFSRWFIRSFIAPGAHGKRTQAPGKIRPDNQVALSVLDDFLRSNQVVRELVSKAADYDVNRIRFHNPFIPGVRFTVGTGLEIISQHQVRHLMQAERVKESADFPRL